MLKNDRFLKALAKEHVDKTPIWIMRQAGRYLPEYRAVRAKAGDFMTLCRTPELACEVTLQPLERFDLDAAIIFSDILTIPDAMGLGLKFVENIGPTFAKPLRRQSDIANLSVPDMEDELGYVMSAIRVTKAALNSKIPLIGFSGSPWTLATYMVEGGPSKTFSIIKSMLFSEPDTLHQLLRCITQSVIEYLRAQIAAGVDAVMLFDTWGGVLTPRDYELFSLQYMREIVQALKPLGVPVIVFTKNGGMWLEQIADSGCDGVGIDWMTNLADARRCVGDKVALQGNMDPSVLYGTPERIREEVQTILQQYGDRPGHIFNLGHGIAKDVQPDNVKVLVDAVHEYSEKMKG